MRWWAWIILAFAAMAFILKVFMSDGSQVSEYVIPDEEDVEALGRMIASENPRDSRLIQVAIAWSAKNMAAKKGISVSRLLMPNGLPGPQAGRYASTVNPASSSDKSIAFDVLSGKEKDPTGGATQFDAPRTQDKLFAQGRVSKTAAQVAADRIAGGATLVSLPGVDPNYMRWWKYV